MSQYPPPPGPPRPPYHSAPRQPQGKAPAIAVVALILGITAIILSPVLLFGIAALIAGFIAINQTGEPHGRPGRGMAVAGVALGGSSLLMGLVVVLLIGIMLPALGAARRTAKRMQNSTQLRGQHQGLVTFANSNKGHYPGLNSKGHVLPDGPQDTGGSGDGDTVQARYWILLEGWFFTPEYAISPSEDDPLVWEYDDRGNPTATPVRWDGTERHYSYAMLSIDGAPGQVVADPQTPHRVHEWNQTLNMQSIVLGDRNTGSNATTDVQSIHNDRPGQWQGSVLWNDNHVAFEQTHILQTQYSTGSMNSQDNLFSASGDTDAYLIHQGD